jgi:hypothetical protein
MFQIKCADCEYYQVDCKNSDSPLSCPNWTFQACCCWKSLAFQVDDLAVFRFYWIVLFDPYQLS